MALPFSLEEFGNLVALALDQGRFEESFLAEPESAADPWAPDLATATIALLPEQNALDTNTNQIQKENGASAGPPTENPLPPLPLLTSNSISSPSSPLPTLMNFSTSTSARREDRAKPAAGTRFFLDKIKRHVLRAAPTATTPDTSFNTHCAPAPTVLAPSPTPTPTHGPQSKPAPTPELTVCTSHPYSHPTLLSGFFDFNDDEDVVEEEDFIPYIPLASQYERNQLAQERRAREERGKRLSLQPEEPFYPIRERPSRRSVFSRPVSSLTDPPPSPSCSVSTSASSHAPITPTASLFPYPAYSYSDTSSDTDAYSYASFPKPPSRFSTSSARSSAGSSAGSAHLYTVPYELSAYEPSVNSHATTTSDSSSSRPNSATSTMDSDSYSGSNSSYSSGAGASYAHAPYPQFADHPFARSQEDPFAKASVQVVARSPARPAPAATEQAKARHRSASHSRSSRPHNPPPARPLPPPPTDEGEGAEAEADPVLPEVPDEWTLWLGASSLPSLAPISTSFTTNNHTNSTPPASPTASRNPRRSSPPSSYLAPHAPKQRSRRKPTPLHLTTGTGTGPAVARHHTSKDAGGDEDWTLSLPFVRPPAPATHASLGPGSWYAPDGPSSPPARFLHPNAQTHRRTRVETSPGRVEHTGRAPAPTPTRMRVGSAATHIGSGYAAPGRAERARVGSAATAATVATSATYVSSGPVRSAGGGSGKPPRTADSGVSAVSSTSSGSSVVTVVPGAAQRMRMGLGGEVPVDVEAEVGMGEEVGRDLGEMGEQSEVARMWEDEMDAESMASGTYYSARSSFALSA